MDPFVVKLYLLAVADRAIHFFGDRFTGADMGHRDLRMALRAGHLGMDGIIELAIINEERMVALG